MMVVGGEEGVVKEGGDGEREAMVSFWVGFWMNFVLTGFGSDRLNFGSKIFIIIIVNIN